MEDYNKVIESIAVRFVKARTVKVLQSIVIENFYDLQNTIIFVHRGEVSFGKGQEKEKVTGGSILFIPGGKFFTVTYGSDEPVSLSNEEFLVNKHRYLKLVNFDNSTADFSYISFDAKIFDTVSFFNKLDITPFTIHNSSVIQDLIKEIFHEAESGFTGKDRVIKLNCERVVVEVVRYILKNRLFVEKLTTNYTYFKDPRLLDIFAYIKQNLGGDLSNKVLSQIAGVSEEYVGQYFKMLTGINPQDYIEYQRMEVAIELLRTTKKSIHEIGALVGYKDTAYFCRRFKMMFGIPAGKMRRRESLMNL